MNIDYLNTDPGSGCPCCSKKFECKPSDISSCNCSKIELSFEEYKFISLRFNTCVCNTCLLKLKKEYAMKVEAVKAKNVENKTVIVVILLLFFCNALQGQTYAPPVGQQGSSAMFMDSSAFINWANGCTLTQGYQDISNPSLGYVTVGDAGMATGKAQSNAVVSLGDGGAAICTFEKPLRNGPGNDFAVFENGFDDTFLELAFVEVSSDGQNFFRFHAHSLTDTVTQTGSFGLTDATKINNLAGKYRGGYGTPFDLQELAGLPGLDINNITHVKILDVVGSITNAYATRDFFNNKINDPWPTAFASGGFDLDAIGVIHESTITGVKEKDGISKASAYPNPAEVGQLVTVTSSTKINYLEVLDLNGSIIFRTENNVLPTESLNKGIYSLRIVSDKAISIQKIIVY